MVSLGLWLIVRSAVSETTIAPQVPTRDDNVTSDVTVAVFFRARFRCRLHEGPWPTPWRPCAIAIVVSLGRFVVTAPTFALTLSERSAFGDIALFGT